MPVIDLPSIVKTYIDKFETQLNTCRFAKIKTFDSVTQTATVTPLVYEAYSDGVSTIPAEIDYVPVVFPASGGGSLTFPVKPDDEVLVFFFQNDTDEVWDTGVAGVPSTVRHHDYNDAVAIVGLRSKGNSLEASTEDVQLRFEDDSGALNSITLGADKSVSIKSEAGSEIKQLLDGTIEITTASTIKIKNSSEELISLISELMALLADASVTTTNTMIGPMPLNSAPQIAALQARLDTLKG